LEYLSSYNTYIRIKVFGFVLETPATAMEKIHFKTNDVHLKNPSQIEISWEKANLTTNSAASLSISIYGYKETTIRPQLMYIDTLEVRK